MQHVNEYPILHYFGIPRHTQSMIASKILTEYFWKFQWKVALWECWDWAATTLANNFIISLTNNKNVFYICPSVFQAWGRIWSFWSGAEAARRRRIHQDCSAFSSSSQQPHFALMTQSHISRSVIICMLLGMLTCAFVLIKYMVHAWKCIVFS